jgi:hypothetical protein
MLSGMVTISLSPLAAQVNANPMPVLPLVGSTITVPGLILPSRSPASIMATPMRSFTDHIGLPLSILARSVAGNPAARLRSRTSGVPPMVWVTLS